MVKVMEFEVDDWDIPLFKFTDQEIPEGRLDSVKVTSVPAAVIDPKLALGMTPLGGKLLSLTH